VLGLAGIDSGVTVGDRLSAVIALEYASTESWEEVRVSVLSDHNLPAEMSFLCDWV
jgi:hypothetical protein